MIKIFFNLLLLLVISSCSNKHNDAIDNLNKSFFKWHNKYSNNMFNTFSTDSLINQKQFIGQSFYRDIKRFTIELNQISSNKISKDRRNSHRVLDDYLNKNLFNYEKIKHHEWNIIKLLDELHSDILYLLVLEEQDAISAMDFDNRVEFISLKINSIYDIKYCHSSNSNKEIISYLLDRINQLLDLSNIKILRQDLENLEDWYNNNYNKLDPFIQSKLRPNYEKYISIELDRNIDVDSTIGEARESLSNYEFNIFNLSLPIYLSSNDEPIWTDYQDTLNVIDWMVSNLNNLSKSNSTCFNQDNIFEIPAFFSSSIMDIHSKKFVEDIYFKSSSITDTPFYFYDITRGRFIALNYLEQDNPIELYLSIINDLFPGDLFIDYSVKASNSLINKVYTKTAYLLPYRSLLTQNYIDFLYSDSFKTTRLIREDCKVEHENYSYMLDLLVNINRIKNCISVISTIQYHYYDIPINETINNYNHLNFFNENEIKKLKIEILGFGIDSIIKFKAYNLMLNLFQDSTLDHDPEYLIGILKDNPNINFNTIENIIK